LARRLDVQAVVVVGSVARGDFNKWSDIDVLVIAEAMPTGTRARLELLMADTPPGVQPIGWTPDELAQRRASNDPLAREAYDVGVVVKGRLPAARTTPTNR
jgi:predicted nucleotidyltransferase